MTPKYRTHALGDQRFGKTECELAIGQPAIAILRADAYAKSEMVFQGLVTALPPGEVELTLDEGATVTFPSHYAIAMPEISPYV